MPLLLSFVEEILNSNSALWFSPDGRKLAYASLNDTLVGTVAIPHYGAHQQYPTMHNLRYPKVSHHPNYSAPAAPTSPANQESCGCKGGGAARRTTVMSVTLT